MLPEPLAAAGTLISVRIARQVGHVDGVVLADLLGADDGGGAVFRAGAIVASGLDQDLGQLGRRGIGGGMRRQQRCAQQGQ
jgi:hypothetical protein